MRLTNVKNSFHIGNLRRTLTAALCSCEKLETELQHEGDVRQALTDALKHSEYAAIAARQLCQQLYPVPPPEIKDAMSVPGEISATEYGMTITIPRLLPARGKESGYIRSTIADLFRDRPRIFLRDVVVAVEQQYGVDLPPRRWRDHDNVELNSLLNELSLWALGGDDPQTVDLFQFATEGEQNTTVIHIVHRFKFLKWIEEVWGKNHKVQIIDSTPSTPPINAAATADFIVSHEPTVGSSATWI